MEISYFVINKNTYNKFTTSYNNDGVIYDPIPEGNVDGVSYDDCVVLCSIGVAARYDTISFQHLFNNNEFDSHDYWIKIIEKESNQRYLYDKQKFPAKKLKIDKTLKNEH